MSKVNALNILASREVLNGAALEHYNKQTRSESVFFNQLKAEGKTLYQRHPNKINGKWYIEQLIKNTNGTFSTVNVLVNKIKSGKFIERHALLSDSSKSSLGDKVKALGLSFN